MDDHHDKFAPEAAELKGPGVEFWKDRRDVNAAVNADENVWRGRRHLADAVSDNVAIALKNHLGSR
jgi:hypothetical protein